jgi:hypothetical protein
LAFIKLPDFNGFIFTYSSDYGFCWANSNIKDLALMGPLRINWVKGIFEASADYIDHSVIKRVDICPAKRIRRKLK